MRRTDRQITDPAIIADMLTECQVCRIALHDDPYPYLVPMNYGFDYQGGTLILYFHCANEGTRLTLLSRDNRVSFEMDCHTRIVPASEACGYSCEYDSVMGNGIMERIDDSTQKEYALWRIMAHYAPRQKVSFPQAALQKVSILKLTAKNLSAKRLRKS